MGSPVINLESFDGVERSKVWKNVARERFPGLSVELDEQQMPVGSIKQIDLGSAQLCAIETPASKAHFAPGRAFDKDWQNVSLMVQSRGEAHVCNGNADVRLKPGDMCLIDERQWFSLETPEAAGILFLRLPRVSVLSRYPHLYRLCGRLLPARESGTRLLSDTLLRISAIAHELSELQRAAVVGSVTQMLGVAEAFAILPESAEWRVRRAVDYIELNLPVSGLTADDVAMDQGISRRRLDQLMIKAHEVTIATYLWNRRMEQAAADLHDPHKSQLSIAQIAFANGYEDAAHFSRAFRRVYEVTPGQWRSVRDG